MSLQVPSLAAWSAHKSDRRRGEHTHLPPLEGAVHLQLRLAGQSTNARSTLPSRSSTSIVPAAHRTQETPADSLPRSGAQPTANLAKPQSAPLLLEALDLDQASANQELALRTPALLNMQHSTTQHLLTQIMELPDLKISATH